MFKLSVNWSKLSCIIVIVFIGLLCVPTIRAASSPLDALAQTDTCFVRVESSGVIYDTIQEAVDSVAVDSVANGDGDTIKVAGYCAGNVRVDEDDPGNLIFLGGYSTDNWTDRDIQANQTVVDGGGGGSRGFILVDVSNITISGFWITNATRGIITVRASDVVIENNYIHDMRNGTSGTDTSYSSGININAGTDEDIYNITIRNNVIWNITAGIGYGISIGRNLRTIHNLAVVNNTIYNVTDDGLQVAQPNQAHTPLDGAIIYNNVIANARSSAVEVFSNAVNVRVDHNCTDNSSRHHIGGTNDVFGDPLFVDIASADFRLRDESPCIDAGMYAELPADDIEGVTRPQGSAYDMGAYESMGDGDVATLFSCADVTEIPVTECEALVALYSSTDGDNWESVDGDVKAGWLQTNTPCSWDGVVCTDGHVSELDRDGSNLSGAIPAEIGNLTRLTVLQLQNNRLTSIPAEIGNLSDLFVLLLPSNQLTAVPAEIGNLTELMYLVLTDNRLTSIPAEIENLTKLTDFALLNNRLTSIPPEIGNLANLVSFSISVNRFTTLPPEILALTNLNSQRSGFDVRMCIDATIAEVEAWNNTTGIIVPSCSVPTYSCRTAEVTEIPLSECDALVALYNSTRGDEWQDSRFNSNENVREGWLQTNMPCSWHGVVCQDGHVVELNKSKSSLSGNIPYEIGDLTHLTHLMLNDNSLTYLPYEIGNLIDLTYLDLFANQFSLIPAEIENLTQLTHLHLLGNRLRFIPAEIGNLTQLNYLDLTNNQLSDIPAEIGNLTNLRHLELASNGLATLPAEFWTLTNLEILILAENQLTTLPAEIGNLTNLRVLVLYDNELTSVPAEIGNLIKLGIGNQDMFDILKNPLTTLPAETVALTNLDNQTFVFEEGVCIDSDAAAVYAWHSITGVTDLQPCVAPPFSCEFATEIPVAECEALVALYHSTGGDNWEALSVTQENHPREGWLQRPNPCTWDGVTCRDGHIYNLIRYRSNLVGDIPAEIGNLTRMTVLDLSGNQLTSLPSEIGNLSELLVLLMSGNQLTTVPTEIGNLTNLDWLQLTDNQLTSVPAKIGDLANLTTLAIEHNRLTSVPAEIGNLTRLTDLGLASNQLTSLPAETWTLTNLQRLSVAINQFTVVPSEIGNLINLTHLNMTQNQLTTFPAELLLLTQIMGEQFGFSIDEGVCVDADAEDVETWRNLIGITEGTTEPQHCAHTDNNLAELESSSIPLSVAVKLEPIQAEHVLMSMIVFALFFIGTFGTFGTFGTYAVLYKRRE